MRRDSRGWSAPLSLLLLLFAGGAAIAQTIPPEVTASATQWPLPNKDYASTRADFDSDSESSRPVRRILGPISTANSPLTLLSPTSAKRFSTLYAWPSRFISPSRRTGSGGRPSTLNVLPALSRFGASPRRRLPA